VPLAVSFTVPDGSEAIESEVFVESLVEMFDDGVVESFARAIVESVVELFDEKFVETSLPVPDAL
jgi:hypothetical protein